MAKNLFEIVAKSDAIKNNSDQRIKQFQLREDAKAKNNYFSKLTEIEAATEERAAAREAKKLAKEDALKIAEEKKKRMPIQLELFEKKGGQIHIKKSHKGKFTEYCDGKVTQECINKGKNSPDAKIRKMAVFAENARKFKH